PVGARPPGKTAAAPILLQESGRACREGAASTPRNGSQVTRTEIGPRERTGPKDMKRSPTTWLGPGLMAAVLALLPGPARAGLILETASLGPSTPTEAYALNATSFLGARFHVSSAVAVDHIGGHFVFQPDA